MKNIFFKVAGLLLVFMFLMPTASRAQAKFGIRLGLNVSNISFDNLPDRGERYGLHGGVFANVPVSDFISLQPELSYSTKGTSFKPENDRKKLNMNYVDFLLPIAFKLSSIDLQVGPFASLLVSSPDYNVFSNNTTVADAFKKGDFGLTAGLSFNFNRMFIGLRYNQGFMDITKDNVRPFLSSGKNAVGQVSVGLKF